MIDPHAHLRDWNQKEKETIKHGLEVAYNSGFDAVFEMPNTEPALNSRENILKRIEDTDKAVKELSINIFHGIFAGLTADKNQIKEVVDTYNKLFPRVVGLKMFAGHSTNNMGIVDEEEQKKVYKKLVELNYDGVLVVHCEKESCMKPELWNPEEPITHCEARPPKAEVESVKDQIKFAIYNNFKGHLHIAHISVPEAVKLVKDAKESLSISCGATPHHCLLDKSFMERDNGIMYKMNPPLRDEESSRKILEYLKEGVIDILESDHAPHTLKDKTREYMSGIPNLLFYPVFIEQFRKEGFSNERIKEMTYDNILRIFNKKKIKIKPIESKENPESFYNDYCFNPYKNLIK